MTIHNVSVSLIHHVHQILNFFFLSFFLIKFKFLKNFKVVDRWKTTFDMKTQKCVSKRPCGIFILSYQSIRTITSSFLKKWYLTVFNDFYRVFIVLSQSCTHKSIILMCRDVNIHYSYIRIETKSSQDVFNHRNKHIDSEMNMLDLTVEFSSFKYLTVEIW